MGTPRSWRPSAVAATAAAVLAAVASTILWAPDHVEAAALAPGWTTGGHAAAASVRWSELERRTPAAAAEAALNDGPGFLAPTSRGWLDRNLRSIRRDLQRAFKKVGKFFKRTAKGISKAVRDVGRAVEKSVRDAARAVKKAGQDVAKFLNKRVKEVRDLVRKVDKELKRTLSKAKGTLLCLVGRSTCLRSSTSRAKIIAMAEAANAQVLVELQTETTQLQEQLEKQVAKVQENIAGLRSLLKQIPPPLSHYIKTQVYPGPRKAGQTALAEASKVIKIIKDETPTVEEVVRDLEQAAILEPSSSKLRTIAQSAQRLLLGLATAENTLAEEMEKLTTVLNEVTAAMS